MITPCRVGRDRTTGEPTQRDRERHEQFEPRISWVLERAATQFADHEATVDLGTGERRTWAETSDRVRGHDSTIAWLYDADGTHVELMSTLPPDILADAHRTRSCSNHWVDDWQRRPTVTPRQNTGRVEVRR